MSVLSKSEMETHISFMADGQAATIYTSDPVWMRKLRKLCDEHPENYSVKEVGKYSGEEISLTVVCADKGLVSLRGGRIQYSDEERARRVATIKAMREAKSEF